MISEHTELSLSDVVLRQAIYAAHNGTCFYTGQYVDFTDMAIDHIFPKSRGGLDVVENYVLTTRSLNIRKSDKLDTTLVERMVYLNKILFAPKVIELYNRASPDSELKIGRTRLRPYLEKNSLYNQLTYPSIMTKVNAKVDYVLVSNKGKKQKWYAVSDLDTYFGLHP